MPYQYENNMIPEGSKGAYLYLLFGRKYHDWMPVIINMFWMRDKRN